MQKLLKIITKKATVFVRLDDIRSIAIKKQEVMVDLYNQTSRHIPAINIASVKEQMEKYNVHKSK